MVVPCASNPSCNPAPNNPCTTYASGPSKTSLLSYNVLFPVPSSACTTLNALHRSALNTLCGTPICFHAARYKSCWMCVIFSNDVCACSGFGGVKFVTGGVSGGIWLFMIRRSFSAGVWLARGTKSAFVTIWERTCVGISCETSESGIKQSQSLPKGFQFGYEEKSSRVTHTVSIGASISICVLALNTPGSTGGKLVPSSARVVLTKIPLVYTTTQCNELLRIMVKGRSEECHVYRC
jgi:hypothetical protein